MYFAIVSTLYVFFIQRKISLFIVEGHFKAYKIIPNVNFYNPLLNGIKYNPVKSGADKKHLLILHVFGRKKTLNCFFNLLG